MTSAMPFHLCTECHQPIGRGHVRRKFGTMAHAHSTCALARADVHQMFDIAESTTTKPHAASRDEVTMGRVTMTGAPVIIGEWLAIPTVATR